MVITGGKINDTTMMTTVLHDISVPRSQGRPRTRPDRVLADTGCPSKANRAWLRQRGIATIIPEREDQIAHRRAASETARNYHVGTPASPPPSTG